MIQSFRKIDRAGRWAAAATLLATLCVQQASLAQDLVAKNFDQDLQGFSGGWGADRAYSWDPAVDAAGNAESGSLRADVDFSAAGDTTLQAALAVSDFAPYDKVRLDVYLDPATKPNAKGDFGTVSVRLRPVGWGWPGTEVPLGTLTKTGWTRFEKPLPASATASVGVNVHWNSGLTGAQSIWIDNLVFVKATAPPPPPALSLRRAQPGLEIRTTGNADYSRKNIGTTADAAPSLSWRNAAGPVTYSMTISETVEAGSSGYAANILLTSGPDAPASASPDWNHPSGIFLEARQTEAGDYSVDLRYKVNAANGHGVRFNDAGLLWAKTNSGLTSLVGTWSLTLQARSLTVQAPGGLTGTAEIPADLFEAFAPGNNTWALFGAQPYTRNDRVLTLSRVRIAGGNDFTAGVDQDFTTASALDPKLQPLQEGTGGVVLRPLGTAWRVTWPLPDPGLFLWSATSLVPNAWAFAGATPITQGGVRTVFLTESANDSAPARFFQLRDQGPKIEPTKVQSYEEDGLPTGKNPPYLGIETSTEAGVSDGSRSLKVVLDNSMTWEWLGQSFGAPVYEAWKKHSKVRFDVHRPVQSAGWNLEVQVGLNADGATWTQGQVMNWEWLNGGATATKTLEFDYSAMKAAAPATGAWWQLNLLFRSAQGGTVYVDNVRFVD